MVQVQQNGGAASAGSARWMKERNDALEAERLSLVHHTLEVQVTLALALVEVVVLVRQ